MCNCRLPVISNVFYEKVKCIDGYNKQYSYRSNSCRCWVHGNCRTSNTRHPSIIKKTDHQQQYIQCQMVHYMVFFSAIIETVTEIETGNNDSWIEEFKKELKKKKQCEGRIEEDFPVESIFNIEIGEIERNNF